jgi:hypothetical protein
VSDRAALARAVSARRSELDRRAGQLEQLQRQISVTEAELENLRHQADLHARVALRLTATGELAQETARLKVEDLATRALQVIFGSEHAFVLKPGTSGGQATLDLLVRSAYPDGRVVETGILEARGGGMAAVIGFVLRLVKLLLTPEIRNILFLDESFGHVSAGFEPRVAEFLRLVCDRTDVQVVLVTHSTVYGDFADQAVRLEQGADGVTIVHRGESE